MTSGTGVRALVLWADATSANLGVRALAAGSAEVLAQVSPGCTVEFQSYGDGPSAPFRMGTKTALRSLVDPGRRLARWLGEYDIVLDTRAGDSFTDAYGLRRLLSMMLVAEQAYGARVPVVMTPQTIGPFSTRIGTWLARRATAHSAAVLARDSTSFAWARGHGMRADAVSSDVVFALPVPPRSSQPSDVVLNVSGLLWAPNPHVDHRAYQRTVQGIYEGLTAMGRHVTLLPHVLRSADPDDDEAALEQFGVTAPEATVLVPRDLGHVRSILASASVVIASRMHACLNALSVGTPAIPLAYSRKFEPLLADIGWPHTVDLRTSSDAASQAVALASSPDLAAGVADVREMADARVDVFVGVLREVVHGLR